MDAWVREGFFSKSKPVWQTGLHSDIVALYEDAIETASVQQAGFQQRLGVSFPICWAWPGSTARIRPFPRWLTR